MFRSSLIDLCLDLCLASLSKHIYLKLDVKHAPSLPTFKKVKAETPSNFVKFSKKNFLLNLVRKLWNNLKLYTFSLNSHH